MTTLKKPGRGESGLENGISYLLIAGVIISLLLEITGVIFLYISNGSLAISHDPGVYIKGSNFFTFIVRQFGADSAQGTAVRFMTAGIVVLILTPYLRLIASVFYFAWEKNYKYVVITLFVLVVVTLSLALH